MLQVRQGFDSLIRLDRNVEVAEPATVVHSGACCKLNDSEEIVLTGNDASQEDLVFFAFNNANVADDINSAFQATGKITVLTGVFVGETDQFVQPPQEVVGSQSETFAVVLNTSDKLSIKVDGGAAQVITLTAGAARTAQQVADDINASLTGALASDEGGSVKIASSSADGHIEFRAVANSAYSVLGFTAGDISSVDKHLASENGKLIIAQSGDYAIARSLGFAKNGVLKFITLSKGGVA